MSKAYKMQYLGIPYIHSVHHLAQLSHSSVQFLNSIVRRYGEYYTAYSIPKRSGGNRFIHSPCDELKSLQRWIHSEILTHLPVHRSCYSYHKNGSIFECAKKHCGSKWLIKFDIENFFDTINEVEVYRVFRKAGYKPMVAFILARVCTYKPISINKNKKNWVQFNTNSDILPYGKKHIRFFGKVPQGAPTSPMLSNLVLKGLDEKLCNYSQMRGGIYSRYADDFFISFSQGDFNRKQVSQIIGKVAAIVKMYGYNLNKTKIKVIPPGSKKIVLGLNVNGEEVQLSKEFKGRIRAHLYGIQKFGIDKHAVHRKFNSIFSMIDHIVGLINYSKQIDPIYGNRKFTELSNCLKSSGIW